MTRLFYYPALYPKNKKPNGPPIPKFKMKYH